MEPHILAMFVDLSNRREEQETILSRLEAGDTTGMVAIFENGFPDEAVRLSGMIAAARLNLAAIEDETAELENVTGQNRP